MLLFILVSTPHLSNNPLCFNTSHVAIYRSPLSRWMLRSPRFNTSHVAIYRRKSTEVEDSKHSFNTSHVAIYLLLHLPLLWLSPCFNTSHVAIYRIVETCSCTVLSVSIHLMLLFIFTKTLQSSGAKRVSIHLMLLFIPVFKCLRFSVVGFQYISCCYLSSTQFYSAEQKRSFNTSHVAIYLISGCR